MASGAVPTPPPHSSGAAVVVRVGEAEAERAGDVQAVAGLELAQALGARPDGLEHELAGGPSARARRTLKARGRNGRSSAPPPHRRAAASM